MVQTNAASPLASLPTAVGSDPGLNAQVSEQDMVGGLAAAVLMNDVILQAITALGVNADGRITPQELRQISAYVRADDALYDAFVEGHGDDEGRVETGFHLVQGDGGTLKFQGRKFVDTVADAIYHVGFKIVDGRFQNEDGDQNERVDDVAGWLNFFLNGENVVFGSGASETLHSGKYTGAVASAASEVFEAAGGNDSIWAGIGDDRIYGGSGDDVSAGDAGDDQMYGGAGADKLWGGIGDDYLDGGGGADVLGAGDGNDFMMGGTGSDQISTGAGDDTAYGNAGHDKIWGQDGNDLLAGHSGQDVMGGGTGDDRMYGGGGHDTLWGEDGNDLLEGYTGNDIVSGGDGRDIVLGGLGNDTLTGGNGIDVFRGGQGKDELLDWEDVDARDIFVFGVGETGLGNQADIIKGFDSGIDRIYLAGFGGLTFVGEDAFSGTGAEVSVSKDRVHIDADGDGAADAEIAVYWVGILEVSDFIL